MSAKKRPVRKMNKAPENIERPPLEKILYRNRYVKPEKNITDIARDGWIPQIQKTPIGILIAQRVGKKVCIGWSRLHKIDREKWNYEVGRKIALGRAMKEQTVYRRDVPRSIKEEYLKFVNRCAKYYHIKS